MKSEPRFQQAILPTWFKDAAKRIIKGGLKRPVSAAALNLLNEMFIAVSVQTSRFAFRSLSGKKGLKVHLGCGPDIRAEWVNIDLTFSLFSGFRPRAPAGATFINHDLRRGLPLEEGSCALIYSSHFLEHLEYRDGVKLMRACYRALRSGGIFRAALPNFKEAFDAYVRGDHEYVELIDILETLPDVEPGTETLVDHINYGVYQFGEHKCMYDEEKLFLVLRTLGFTSVYTSAYREDMDLADPVRRRYSFYIEAIK